MNTLISLDGKRNYNVNLDGAGAPNENKVQNHLNIALLNIF